MRRPPWSPIDDVVAFFTIAMVAAGMFMLGYFVGQRRSDTRWQATVDWMLRTDPGMCRPPLGSELRHGSRP